MHLSTVLCRKRQALSSGSTLWLKPRLAMRRLDALVTE